MGVKNIKYKPLGASIQKIGAIQPADTHEQIKGYQSLSSRIDSLNKSLWQDIGYKTQMTAAEDAGEYKAYTYGEDGNIVFNDAPTIGSSVYDRAYYKHVQENAKFQIKTLVDSKLQNSFYKNQYNLAQYNIEKKEIKDGIMSALVDKNSALTPYFEYDIDASSTPWEAKIFTNEKARTKNVQETLLHNMRDSHYKDLLMENVDTEAGAKRLGVWVNEVYHEFVSHGPSDTFVAGNIVYDADPTRRNNFSVTEFETEIVNFRKAFQRSYVLSIFDKLPDSMKAVELISQIRDGSYETVDFLNPESLSNGETALTTKKVPLATLIGSPEERLKLANDIEQQHLDRKTRIQKHAQLEVDSMETQARAEVTSVLDDFMTRQMDNDFNRPHVKKLMIQRLDEIGRSHPSLKGLKVVEEAKDIINSENLPTTSDATELALFERQAQNGNLDTSELLKSRLISQKDRVKLWKKQIQWDSGEITIASKKIYQDAVKRIRSIDGGDSAFNIFSDKTDRNNKVNALENKLLDFFRDIQSEHNAVVGARGDGTVNPQDVAKYLENIYNSGDLILTQSQFRTKKNELVSFTKEEDSVKSSLQVQQTKREEIAKLNELGDTTRANEKKEELDEILANFKKDFPDIKELKASINDKNKRAKALQWTGEIMLIEKDVDGTPTGTPKYLTTDNIIELLVTDPRGFLGGRNVDYANTFNISLPPVDKGTLQPTMDLSK
jgi:hypothetical protein